MDKITGVNLGGWLVLEKWMTPRLFDDVQAEDEYYLVRDLSEIEYKSRMKVHRASFINEADFLRISSEGFNTVRIPVPYFIFGDCSPFLGCIDELDHAFEWAQAYNLKILIDLHTVPFSQNGFDNGGLSGVCRWAQIPEAVDFAMDVLVRLAERYKNRPALWGIEIINEPITKNMWDTMNPMDRYPARDSEISLGSKPISLSFLYEFYLNAYNKLRGILPEEIMIVFHDGFELHQWKSFFEDNNFTNVMLDTHQYVMVAEANGTTQTLSAYIEYLKTLAKEIHEVTKYVRVFVGEWSLFNSYAIGVDTKGGINPTQEKFETTEHLSKDELKEFYQILWRESINAWNQGEGHIYWTYKLDIDTINEPEWYGWDSWDMNRCLAHKWIEI